MSYAEKTAVSSDKSRAEIEKTLSKYGASSFMYAWSSDHAQIAFDMAGRRILFCLPLPDKNSRAFTHTGTGRLRDFASRNTAYEQAVRQRWRALALIIKAKLESIDSGITEFDEEFLAHILLPNGKTVGDLMVPQIEQSYATGTMPLCLPFQN